MDSRERKFGWLAIGALGGAVVVVLAWLASIGTSHMPWEREGPTQRPSTPAATATPAPAPAVASDTPAPAAPEVATAAVPISVSTCPPQPSVPVAADRRDGNFALESAMEADPLPSASAFLAVGREAAQQGRARDAEVAFIAACRVAERHGGSHSVRVADAKAQLGEHYVAMAARSPGAEGDLFRRATVLLSESADAYAVALGKNASRTRIAEQRLAAVRTGSPEEAASRMASVQDASVLGAARSGLAEEAAERSSARQLISSDPELAQLESDIGRLQAQASRVTRDPAGMRKRDAEAMARAAQCEDKPCLLRWYAQRRSQLLNEF